LRQILGIGARACQPLAQSENPIIMAGQQLPKGHPVARGGSEGKRFIRGFHKHHDRSDAAQGAILGGFVKKSEKLVQVC
jgi:hypothetical protein